MKRQIFHTRNGWYVGYVMYNQALDQLFVDFIYFESPKSIHIKTLGYKKNWISLGPL